MAHFHVFFSYRTLLIVLKVSTYFSIRHLRFYLAFCTNHTLTTAVVSKCALLPQQHTYVLNHVQRILCALSLLNGTSLSFSVFLWCHSRKFLEEAGEVLRILETEMVGNLRDALRRVEEQLFAQLEDMLLDVILRRHSRLLADEIAEIAGGETGLASEVGHRGQAATHGQALLEIVFDVALKSREDI